MARETRNHLLESNRDLKGPVDAKEDAKAAVSGVDCGNKENIGAGVDVKCGNDDGEFFG